MLDCDVAGVPLWEGEAVLTFLPGDGACPVLLNSPHSGDVFPESFLMRSQLGLPTLRKASDLFVEDLIRPLHDEGLPILAARLPRSFLDLSREPQELDPRLIDGLLPPGANTRSLRVAGGLGVVPRVVCDQTEIYAGKLPLEDVLARISGVHRPYHARLSSELDGLARRHGRAVLVDMHSMPSTGPSGRLLPDFVLGDRFGTSAAPALMDALEALIAARGFRVERNQPYAGGYITEFYGRPAAGRHAIQIEINRALYMDEGKMQPHRGFAELKETLRAVLLAFVAWEAFENSTTPLHFYQRAAE